MVVNEFAGVFLVVAAQFRIVGFLQQHVVTHATSDEQVLYLRVVAYFAVELQDFLVVRVHVVANLGREAAGAGTLLAAALVAAAHVVHVGARAAQIGDGTGKTVHLGNQIHFAQNAFAATACNKFALVRVDGAETATTETSAVRIDAELDHVERGHGSALFVTRVRFAGVRVFKALVQLAVFKRRVRGVYYDGLFCDILQNAALEPLVAFNVHLAAVFHLCTLAREAFLVTGEAQVFPMVVLGDVPLGREVGCLRNRIQAREGYSLFQKAHDFFEGLFSHAVHENVGLRIE